MAFKFVVFAALVAYAHAGAIGYSAPIAAYQEPIAYAGHGGYHGEQIAIASGYGQAGIHGEQIAIASGYGHGAIHAAAPVAVAAPVAAVHTRVSDESYDPHPQYSYSYDVHDTITGDVKAQHEERDGDVVRGSYSLIEPDGSKRTVEYAADAHSGFNAIVHREPATHAVAAVAHHAAPVAVAHHAAPVAIAQHAAPVAIASHDAGLAYEAHGHHGYY